MDEPLKEEEYVPLHDPLFHAAVMFGVEERYLRLRIVAQQSKVVAGQVVDNALRTINILRWLIARGDQQERK